MGEPIRPTIPPAAGASAAKPNPPAAVPPAAAAPDPMSKPSLTAILQASQTEDYNEGAHVADPMLKMLPGKIEDVPVVYYRWEPRQAVNVEPLYPFAHLVTRDHFKRWVPETHFCGGVNPLHPGQIPGALPCGNDLYYYWIEERIVRQMHERDMDLQREKLKGLARATSNNLDPEHAGEGNTVVTTHPAKMGQREVDIND